MYKHPDSEDECRGWDGLGRLNPAIGYEYMHRARKQSQHRERKNTTKEKKRDGGVGPSARWQGMQHARPERYNKRHYGGSNPQCTHPGYEREGRVWARRVRAGEGPTTCL